MNLPPVYQWLLKEPGPRVIKEFINIYGVREVPGSKNSALIMGWARELGDRVGINYPGDYEAWCGLAAGIITKRAGFEPPPICVRASAWDKFGNESQVPMLGDFLRFQRTGGGHIGLYIGEDDPKLNIRNPCYYVAGGNQGDTTSIIPIEKSRLVTARRCPWKIAQPDNVRRIYLSRNGEISKNER